MLSMASRTKSGFPPSSCSSAASVYIALIASTSASGRILRKWSCRHALVTAREQMCKHNNNNNSDSDNDNKNVDDNDNNHGNNE